jgi:hypothetical protein
MLHGKRNFADVIEDADFKKGHILDCPCGPGLIPQAVKSRDWQKGCKRDSRWKERLALVAHVCNPSYSGGRDQEDHSLKPAWANSA